MGRLIILLIIVIVGYYYFKNKGGRHDYTPPPDETFIGGGIAISSTTFRYIQDRYPINDIDSITIMKEKRNILKSEEKVTMVVAFHNYKEIVMWWDNMGSAKKAANAIHAATNVKIYVT